MNISAKGKGFRELNEEIADALRKGSRVELTEVEGHRVGGYPSFTQLDPREYDQNFQEHTVLLFQLDSNDEDGIMWGDSGVCNFFIRPDDLAKRDFSGVLYNWDCY